MRPTGRLHLGHYFGALQNWLKLQDEYECFFFVADWHALTTHYEDTSSIAQNTRQVAMDWLAVGIDPEKATLFVQSSILEHAELHVLLSMITPLSWLERVPTYKEQIENLKERDLGTYGFLGYPLLQSADIVIYDADFVPVGEDQVPHVEITREVVRRFNAHFGLNIDRLFMPECGEIRRAVLLTIPRLLSLAEHGDRELYLRAAALLKKHIAEIGIENFYESLIDISSPQTSAMAKELDLGLQPPFRQGWKQEVKRLIRVEQTLREPKALLTETPRLPGLDGRRMAKSYGNAIWLSDTPDEIRTKVRNMMTDPQRQRRTDPGRPEICPVFAYHKLFSPPETVAQVDRDCRTAAIGCVDCKKLMADGLVKWIEPVQTRRKEFEANPRRVWDILDAGNKKARKAAVRTMKRVRNAIFKWDEARKSSSSPAR